MRFFVIAQCVALLPKPNKLIKSVTYSTRIYSGICAFEDIRNRTDGAWPRQEKGHHEGPGVFILNPFMAKTDTISQRGFRSKHVDSRRPGLKVNQLV